MPNLQEYNKNFPLVSVQELIKNKYTFYIPSFQRGYRWGELEVWDLLCDLAEFVTDENKTQYLLQPLVVRKTDVENCANKEYDVLDGQQRLTTLLVFLQWFKTRYNKMDSFFSIEYAYQKKIQFYAREGADEGLNLAAELDWTQSPNHFFIRRAYECFEWPKGKHGRTSQQKQVKKILRDSTKLNDIYNILLGKNNNKSVKFIWYDCTKDIRRGTDHDLEAIRFFNKFNNGKIPLTSSDLIKALFVLNAKRENRDGKAPSPDLVQTRTNLILSQWDSLEKYFQNADFVTFAFKPHEIKDHDKEEPSIPLDTNSLDELFNFVTHSSVSRQNPLPAYRYFQNKNEELNAEQFSGLWQQEVLTGFDDLLKWYEDIACYNCIGWLVYFNKSIKIIREKLEDKEHNNIHQKLVNLIGEELLQGKDYAGNDLRGNDLTKKKTWEILLDSADYEENPVLLRKLLLLFNIALYTAAGQKFPFSAYYKDKWDLEHIASQHDKDIPEKYRSDWKNWVCQSLKFENPVTAKVQDLLEAIKEPTEKYPNFKALYEGVDAYYAEKYGLGKDEDKHDISNLVLLDEHTNRSYQNAPFPAKLYRIVEKDHKGELILLGTKNAFLHYYSFLPKKPLSEHMDIKSLPNNLLCWELKDREKYRDAIEVTLKDLFDGGYKKWAK